MLDKAIWQQAIIHVSPIVFCYIVLYIKKEVIVDVIGKYRYYHYAMNDGTKHNLAEFLFYS